MTSKIENKFLNQYLGEWVVLTHHNGEQTEIKVTGYTLGGYSLHYIYGTDKEGMKCKVELETVRKIKSQGEIT